MLNPGIKDRIASLKHGDHACLIFKEKEDQMDAVIPFLMIGLERKERCVFLGDPLSVQYARERLKEEGVDVEEERRRGVLILTSDRDYLQNNAFSPEAMIWFLEQGVQSALKSGFKGLRATGDVLWELGTDLDVRKLFRYERMLDSFFAGKKLTGLCQYRMGSLPHRFVRHSFYTHPIVVMERQVRSGQRFYNPLEPYSERPEKKEIEAVESMCRTVLHPPRYGA